MRIVVDGKPISASVQARKVGNCRLVFRWGTGTPKPQVTLTTSKRRPRDVSRAEVDALVADWWATIPKSPKVAPTAFKEAVSSHLRVAHAAQTGKRLRQPERALEKLGEVLGWPDVASITKEDFRAAIPKLREGIEAKTWATEGGEMRHFSLWLVDEDMIQKDFTRGVKFPGKREFGRREDVYPETSHRPIRDWLLENAEEDWAHAWDDFWFTGMDSQDLFEFDPVEHTMLLPPDNLKIWKIRSKEGFIIDQPIDSAIRARWMRLRKEGVRRLHPTAAGFKNADSWGAHLRRLVQEAQKALGLPTMGLKTTRHTWLTRHVLRLVRGEPNAPTMIEIRRWGGWAPGSTIPEGVYLKFQTDGSKAS